MIDYKALCAELVDIATAHCNPDDYSVGYCAAVLDRACAALAAEPEPPADGEVAELVGLVDACIATYSERPMSSGDYVLIDDGKARAALLAKLMGRLAEPGPMGPTDKELCKVLHQAICEFPPTHPDAIGLTTKQYELALEVRKARAVLARWGRS